MYLLLKYSYLLRLNIYIYIYIISELADRNQWRPEGLLFNSYYTKVLGRALLLSFNRSTLPLIRTLQCWELSKVASSTILSLWYGSSLDWLKEIFSLLLLVKQKIGHHVNARKTEYKCYNQTGDISTLDGTSLKLVDKFTYIGSSVPSTEKDIDTWLTKAWTAIHRLLIIWKPDLTDKMKRRFFQAAVVSILLYGRTTWTITKQLKKKLDGNYTRMLRAILNKSWRQHPTKHLLYS